MTLRWKRRLVFTIALALSSYFTASWLEARVSETLRESALTWTRGLYETALLTRLSLPEADSVETMTLNGAGIRLSTAHVASAEMDPDAILRRARTDCTTPHSSSPTSEPPLIDSPVYLSKKDSEGALFCFKAKEPLDSSGLLRAGEQLSETGDLASWGTFHAVYVRSHGAQVTTFTVELLEGFRPADMFPEKGDAPGGDIQRLPRPAGRRILSLSHDGSVALTGYRTTTSAAKSLEEYLSDLEGAALQTWRHPNASDSVFVRSNEESFLVTTQPIGEESALFLTRLPD